MKKFLTILLVLMIAAAFALAITACKDEEEEDPPVETEKPQHSPNVTMFVQCTATITTNDTFTDTQWNAIVTAIVGKFSTAYNSATTQQQEAYRDVLDQGVTITVEKNPNGYTNYKATGYTLYLRANGVNNLDAHAVIVAMATGEGVTQ
jgi:hypothetical protein